MFKTAVGKYTIHCLREGVYWNLGFGKRPELHDDLVINSHLYRVIKVMGSDIFVTPLRRKVTVPTILKEECK